jgi:hypothetical protein
MTDTVSGCTELDSAADTAASPREEQGEFPLGAVPSHAGRALHVGGAMGDAAEVVGRDADGWLAGNAQLAREVLCLAGCADLGTQPTSVRVAPPAKRAFLDERACPARRPERVARSGGDDCQSGTVTNAPVTVGAIR